MAEYRSHNTLGYDPAGRLLPPRTPGSLGIRDAADPALGSRLGPTPGSVGSRDGSDPNTDGHPGLRASNPLSLKATSRACGKIEVKDPFTRKVIEILQGVKDGIEVSLGGFTVTSADVRGIGGLVGAGAIVVQNLQDAAARSENAVAGYVSETTTFAARSPLTGEETVITRPGDRILIYIPLATTEDEAAVVHEAVHAVFDRKKWKTTRRIQELTAYVFEAWYLWLVLGRKFKPKDPDTRHARNVAILMAAVKEGSHALPNFKAQHPNDWKARLERALKHEYGRLVHGKQVKYEQQGGFDPKTGEVVKEKFSDVIDVDGILKECDL